MNDGNVFAISAGDTVNSGQLAYTKSGDDSADALHTSITVGGIGGIQLIAVADPFKPGLGQIVKGNKVEVAWKSVDRPDSDLVEPRKEVLSHVDGLSQIFRSDILASHREDVYFLSLFVCLFVSRS